MEHVIFYLFFLSGLIALYHFIAQGVILPSLRMTMRFKLFALRDELRRLKIEDPSIDKDVFLYAQGSLNNVCNLLGHIDFYLINRVKSMLSADAQLAARTKRRQDEINQNAPAEVKRILAEAYKVGAYATIANTGWTLYVVPVAFALAIPTLPVILCVKAISKVIRSLAMLPESISAWASIRQHVAKRLEPVSYIPEREMGRMIPEELTSAVA